MKLWLSISLTFAAVTCVVTLCGAPDPDLFDGRFSAAASDLSTTADGADGEDKSLEDNDSSGERDGNGESSSEVTAEGNADSQGQTAGSGKPGSGSSSAEATTSASNGSGRSCEEFEVGVFDKTNGQIDVNRSKEFSAQTEPAAAGSSNRTKSDQTANSDVQNSDKSARNGDPGDQQSHDGTGSADYGTSVPSGL